MITKENAMNLNPGDGETGAPAGGPGGEGSGLPAYARIKLEIADILISATRIAREDKDDENEERGRRLLARIAEDRFNLVVAGQFNTGKSSLMNAILGRKLLPVGVLPMTSLITTVRYGNRERLLVQREGRQDPQEEPIANLGEYVTACATSGSHARVTSVEVELPSEILRRGFCLVDTPGVGSTVTENTATTMEFLPEADAVVFVTSFESPLSEAELAFLRTVNTHVRKIFIAVNKSDLVSANEREDVLAFLRSRISQELKTEEVRLIAVSARDALAAKLNNRSDLLDACGLKDLEQTLVDFMTRKKAEEFLKRLADRTFNLLDRQKAEMAVVASASRDPAAAAARRQKLDEEVDLLRHMCSGLAEDLRLRIDSEVGRRFEADLEMWRGGCRTEMVEAMSLSLAPGHIRGAFRHLDEVATQVRSIAAKSLESWHKELWKDFVRNLWELGGEDLERMSRLPEEVSRTALALFGLSLPESSEVSDRSGQNVSCTLALENARFEWKAPRFAILQAIPLEWLRNSILHRCKRTLDQALDACRRDVLDILARAAVTWIDDFAREIGIRITARVSRVQHLLNGQGKPEKLETLATLKNRMVAVMSVLSGFKPSSEELEFTFPVAPIERSGDSRAFRKVGTCRICSTASKALVDFMCHRQYELAVSERTQQEHSKNCGFCALHTWQYAKLAAPRDICLAYPRVLSSMAERIKSLAGASATDTNEDIRALLPRRSRCPACEVIANAERAVVREILSAMGSDGHEDLSAVSPLCLPHLVLVVDTAPNPAQTNALLLHAAQILERVAEDMRNHALKHEAVRRWLITDEEANSPSRGLALLVGSATLAAPWSEEIHF